jgi:hypothetical protein
VTAATLQAMCHGDDPRFRPDLGASRTRRPVPERNGTLARTEAITPRTAEAPLDGPELSARPLLPMRHWRRRTSNVVNEAREMAIDLRIAGLFVALAASTAALTGAARAAEDDSAAHRPGRAAAHAALIDGADLPTTPPSLPELALEAPRRAPEPGSLAKKGELAREADSQADLHAGDNGRAARDEAANRIAQASLVGAVRSAAADERIAAAQARTTNAKAKAAAGRPPGGPRPTPGRP